MHCQSHIRFRLEINDEVHIGVCVIETEDVGVFMAVCAQVGIEVFVEILVLRGAEDVREITWTRKIGIWVDDLSP